MKRNIHLKTFISHAIHYILCLVHLAFLSPHIKFKIVRFSLARRTIILFNIICMIVFTIIKQTKQARTYKSVQASIAIIWEGLKLIQSCSSSDDVDEDHKVEDNES